MILLCTPIHYHFADNLFQVGRKIPQLILHEQMPTIDLIAYGILHVLMTRHCSINLVRLKWNLVWFSLSLKKGCLLLFIWYLKHIGLAFFASVMHYKFMPRSSMNLTWFRCRSKSNIQVAWRWGSWIHLHFNICYFETLVVLRAMYMLCTCVFVDTYISILWSILELV